MRSRGGFVLIAAVWLLTAIAASALHLSIASRSMRLAVNNGTDRLVLEAAARAALSVLRAELRAGRHSGEHSGDGWHRYHESVATLDVAPGMLVTVEIEDAASRLPAMSDPSRLRSLMAALGIESAIADSTAELIVSLQGEHDLVAVPGCAGGGWDSANDRVREAGARVRAALTRTSPLLLCAGTLAVNVRTAPREVLLTLPGFSGRVADALIHRRRLETLSSVLDIANDLDSRDRAAFLNAVPALLAATTSTTAALLVTITVRGEHRTATLTLEAMLIRTAAGADVAWTRTT